MDFSHRIHQVDYDDEYISDTTPSDDGVDVGDDASEVEPMLQSQSDHDPSPDLTAQVSLHVRTFIVDTYRQCWTDFYEDEYSICTQTLCALADDEQFVYDVDDLPWLEWDPESDHGMDVDEVSAEPSFAVTTHDGDHIKKRVIHARTVEVPTHQPYSRYHACTPAHTHLYNDGVTSQRTLQSIRFGGLRIPEFDEREYVKFFRFLAWQAPFSDPDCE